MEKEMTSYVIYTYSDPETGTYGWTQYGCNLIGNVEFIIHLSEAALGLEPFYWGA
jgi:hypothetical protein